MQSRTRTSIPLVPDARSGESTLRTTDSTAVTVRTRVAAADDAELVHALYAATPQYFDVISIPVPTVAEVRTDLETAAADPRRRVELVLLPDGAPARASDHGAAADTASVGPSGSAARDPATGWVLAGYLDYKLDYPDPGDATVNLLLVRGGLQSRGIGAACARDLEARLHGRARRVLASIYGENPRARRFWENLGYVFAIDARPILDWYAKQLD